MGHIRYRCQIIHWICQALPVAQTGAGLISQSRHSRSSPCNHGADSDWGSRLWPKSIQVRLSGGRELKNWIFYCSRLFPNTFAINNASSHLPVSAAARSLTLLVNMLESSETSLQHAVDTGSCLRCSRSNWERSNHKDDAGGNLIKSFNRYTKSPAWNCGTAALWNWQGFPSQEWNLTLSW